MKNPLERIVLSRHAFEPLDSTDRRLIAELQSHPAAEFGVLSYRAEVDPRALGYSICAIVRVSPGSRDIQVIPRLAREVPEITECYRITGEDCYFMKLYLRTIDDLEPILDRFTPHGRTTTSIVHSAPVPPRPLPVLGQPDGGS